MEDATHAWEKIRSKRNKQNKTPQQTRRAMLYDKSSNCVSCVALRWMKSYFYTLSGNRYYSL